MIIKSYYGDKKSHLDQKLINSMLDENKHKIHKTYNQLFLIINYKHTTLFPFQVAYSKKKNTLTPKTNGNGTTCTEREQQNINILINVSMFIYLAKCINKKILNA